MNFSAAASSSPVVTPGRILPASRSIVLTRIAPAAAILSISAGDFLMIMASETFFEAQSGEGRADVVMDLDLVLRPVEPPEQAAVVVVVDQRLGLLMVGLESLLDLVGLVVGALAQRLAALVALALVLGRVEVDVVQMPLGALPPAREALDDDV